MIKKKRMNKRAIDLQFNWIFVIIGGAIFLGFFISLIRNIDTGESQQTSQESTQELDSLIKVSSAVTDTQKIIVFKTDRKITFSCIDEVSQYQVEGALSSARYDYNAVFSPTELSDKDLVIQTFMFEAPFRVIPLVYVTDKSIEYVFIGDSALINIIFNSMPSGTVKKTISLPELAGYPDNNYDRVVFIIDEDDYPFALQSTALYGFNNARNRVFAVGISTPGNQIEYGQLTFYRYVSNSFINEGVAPFLETSLTEQKSTLALGGVISHDRELYACNVKKVLRRLVLMAELHNQRLNLYKDYYDNLNAANMLYSCNDYYDGAKGNLSIMAYVEEPTLSMDDFINLRMTINNLELINNLISILGDCARIY